MNVGIKDTFHYTGSFFLKMCFVGELRRVGVAPTSNPKLERQREVDLCDLEASLSLGLQSCREPSYHKNRLLLLVLGLSCFVCLRRCASARVDGMCARRGQKWALISCGWSCRHLCLSPPPHVGAGNRASVLFKNGMCSARAVSPASGFF